MQLLLGSIPPANSVTKTNCSCLSEIEPEADLQIFLNKIIVWFDAVTLKKHPVIEIVQSPSALSKLLLIFYRYSIIRYRPFLDPYQITANPNLSNLIDPCIPLQVLSRVHEGEDPRLLKNRNPDHHRSDNHFQAGLHSR